MLDSLTASVPPSSRTRGRNGGPREIPVRNDRPGRIAWRGVARACLIGTMLACCVMFVLQLISPVAPNAFGLSFDRLATVSLLLVSSIGLASFVYAERCMEGDPVRDRFLARLFWTIVTSGVFMIATDLRLMFAAWTLTSVGLHLLLTNDPTRIDAPRPARKKFLISRLGDLALIAAIVLIRTNWGTYDLTEFVRSASSADGIAFAVVGFLVVTAALTKSAQFPFHSWLPETMESPTPVSILMHAGIINAGGVLLIRFAPVLAPNNWALAVLSIVGTLTMTLGLLTMWAQVEVKRTLAWSTVSQMGFMMVQFGLGAFASAALHIIGHGYYKAWSFGRSGMLESKGNLPAPSPAVRLAWVAYGVAASVPAFVAARFITGFSPLHSPGELALTACLALSIGHLWASTGAGRPADRQASRRRLGLLLGLTLAVAVASFGLYRVTGSYLAPVLGSSHTTPEVAAWVAAAVPVAALIVLTIIHAFLPVFDRNAWGRAFHVHALNGFYLGVIADRVSERIWNTLTVKGVERG